MKTEYQYIKFVIIRELPKTKVWNVINKRTGVTLAGIAWYPAWRQYVLYTSPEIEAVFNAGCLVDIQDFLKQLKEGK